MTHNSVLFEILKVTKYRGKPYTLHYRVRKQPTAPPHSNIPYEWIEGRIRLDMSKIFSASFQGWHDLEFDEERREYRFDLSKDRRGYCVIEEIVLAVEKFNFEYHLLGKRT